MPRLWNDTIEEHRRSVRNATLDATAALVARSGLLSVTMSQIAAEAGIGRATLYKYFPDVEAILLAWHERLVATHLDHLTHVSAQAGGPGRRLDAVLQAYARIGSESGRHPGGEVAAALHRGEHAARAEQRLRELFQGLLTQAAATGDVRDDVAPVELASYCLHALGAARSMPSKAAVDRLVQVTLAGLRSISTSP